MIKSLHHDNTWFVYNYDTHLQPLRFALCVMMAAGPMQHCVVKTYIMHPQPTKGMVSVRITVSYKCLRVNTMSTARGLQRQCNSVHIDQILVC